MINLHEYTPEVYYKQSRDFQLLGRLYDVILNSVKTNADALYYLPQAYSTMQTRMLDLLSYTLGFTAKHNYNNTQLMALCSVFPTLLRLKGSLAAIQLLGDTLLSAEGVDEKFNCEIVGNEIQLFLPPSLSTSILFNDVLEYILPAGMTCAIVRASVDSVEIATELEIKPSGIHMYFDEEGTSTVDLTNLSIIPSLSVSKPDGVKKNSEYISNHTKYSRIIGLDENKNEIYKPTKAMSANSAVLDFGRLTGLVQEAGGYYDGGNKTFYDIRYELPTKLDYQDLGLFNELETNSANLETWCKKAEVSYGACAVSEEDFKEAPLLAQLKFATGLVGEEKSSDGFKNIYLQLPTGTHLAGATIRLPDKNYLEAVYAGNYELTGYTFQITKRQSDQFSLYSESISEIVSLLDSTMVLNKPAEVHEIEFSYSSNTANLYTNTLVTELITDTNLTNNKIVSEKFPSKAKAAYEKKNNVYVTFYTTTTNQNGETSTSINSTLFSPTADELITETKVINRNYPSYAYCFADVEAQAYQLPQLYNVDKLPFSGRFTLIIRPKLKFKEKGN